VYFTISLLEDNNEESDILLINNNIYAVRRWAIIGDIKMVADEIGHASVVMTENYAKCNIRRLQDDFLSLRERIALRLVPPTEDIYFTNQLKVI